MAEREVMVSGRKDRCPYCHDTLGGETFTCESCQTTHHRKCWDEQGGCTVLGCSGNTDDRSAVASKLTAHAAFTGPPRMTRDGKPLGWREVEPGFGVWMSEPVIGDDAHPLPKTLQTTGQADWGWRMSPGFSKDVSELPSRTQRDGARRLLRIALSTLCSAALIAMLLTLSSFTSAEIAVLSVLSVLVVFSLIDFLVTLPNIFCSGSD